MNERGCYCDTLWEKNPEFLEKQDISRGFCGICERCRQPGHTRHFPGAVPYTGAWCDQCYNVVGVRHYIIRLAWLLFLVIGILWLIRYFTGG